MKRTLNFFQIILAVVIGTICSDLLKGIALQCLSKDSRGCAETRIECVWNSRTTPSVIHSCFIESMV